MMSVLVSALVFIATALQTKVSAKEVGEARRPAMDWWTAEDELVSEARFWWRRIQARRELKTWRDDETAKAIRHVELVLWSWMMLMVAALAAFGNSLWDLWHA